jgi:transcriptional regulator with XRE-family HTH domain
MSADSSSVLIGQNVRHARKAMHWNQTKLAKLLGVTRQTLLSWEQGATHIPSDKLIQASKLLGRDIRFFFEEEHAALRYM